MTEQRWSNYSRRSVLSGFAALAGSSFAGCTATGHGRTPSDGTPEGSPNTSKSSPIQILAAGSLQLAFSRSLTTIVDSVLDIEAHGSATITRLIIDGARNPDIVVLADPSLLASINLDWSVRFASNALVLAYNPATSGGKTIHDTDRDNWYLPLIEGEVTLGRTDPDLDPLGYRTLFLLTLASRYYDDAHDFQQLLERNQIYPETALLSQFETGAIDAAFTYQSMAIERDYAFIPLPDQINLSNPRYRDEWYTSVSYTLSSGETISGDVIQYTATIHQLSDRVLDVFRPLASGEYLESHGFIQPDGYPAYHGDVPNSITN